MSRRLIVRFFVRAACLCAALVTTGCDEEFLRRLQEAIDQGLLTPPPGYETQLTSANPSQEAPGQDTSSITSAEETSRRVFTASAPGETCTDLIVGPPRGLACLHCMQPEAAEQAQVVIETLVHSCLKNIAINYLVDGTFSFNEDLLQNHIDLLTQNGRQLFINFYITNGPTQRRWKSTTIDAFGTKISPEVFRWRILNDRLYQAQYMNLVERLNPTLHFANDRHAVINVIPALEDNLREPEFMKLFELTLDALPADVAVGIGRNPCPGCYDGNDGAIPTGVFEEHHTTTPNFSVVDGVITNDGKDYSSPASGSGDVPLEDLAPVRDLTGHLNSLFILWSGKRQGVRNHTFPHPSTREYPSPSKDEQIEIIQFLREGLS